MRGGRLLLVLAMSGISAQAQASVSAYISARESNSLGIKGDWDSDGVTLSGRDCVDDIEVTLTISVSSSEDTDGRELYIFAGSNCDDSVDSDDCDEDIIKLDADETTVSLSVSFLIDTDDCTDSDSSSIWVGLLDSADEKDDNATWATALDVDFEGAMASAPSDVTVSPGENNLYLTWTAPEDYDEDPAGFLLVYASAESTEDAGVDGGTSDALCSGPLYEGESVTAAMSWKAVSSGATEAGRIAGLTNDQFYQVAVATVDEYGNVSPLSEVLCEEPGETVDFFEIYSAMGGSTSGDFCFVATAAFGDLDHPTVRILRRFRDEVLLRLPFGRAWVAWYYRVGPSLASSIHGDSEFAMLRAGLLTVAGWTLVAMDFNRTFASALLGVLLFLFAAIGAALAMFGYIGPARAARVRVRRDDL